MKQITPTLILNTLFRTKFDYILNKSKALIGLLLSLLLSGQLSAQNYTAYVQQFGLKEGLAHYEVSAIFKDKDGFLWVATTNNLQRYDGYEFKSYSLNTIPHKKTFINLMGQDEAGWIWFHFNPNEQSEPTPLYFLNPLTGEIVEDEKRLGNTLAKQVEKLLNADDQKTILHHKNQLYCYHSGENQITVVDFKTGIKRINTPDFEGRKMKLRHIDTQGYFWLADSEFLFRISPDGERSERIRIGQTAYNAHNRASPPNAEVNIPYINEWENDIYFRRNSVSNGLVQRQIYRYEASGEHQRVFTAPTAYHCIEILDGQIWCIGEAGWKVFDLSGELLFELKKEDYEEHLFKFRRLIKSRQPNEYYIYSDHGLNIIEVQKNLFTNYFSRSKGSSLPFYTNASRGIFVENDSVLVNFDRGGLVLFQKEQPQNYQILIDHGSNLYTNKFTRPYYGIPIIRDATKHFWIGEISYLSRWAPDLSEVEDLLLSKAHFQKGIGHTLSLFEDINPQKDTCIWSADRFGLRRYCSDQQMPTSYSYEEAGFKSKKVRVYQILQDQQSSELFWLCTDGGLYVFDKVKGKVLHHYHEEAAQAYKLPATVILHMYVDSENNRWLATRSGLFFWNDTTQEKRLFNRDDGFSNEVIYAVYEDDYNRLWLSSDYGIMSLDKATFEVQIYLPKDGLSQTEFNRMAHFKEKDGTIYFGGMNGVTAFHPKDFQGKETNHNSMVLSEIDLFDGNAGVLVNKLREVTETQSITFRPDDRFFKIKFVLPVSGDQSTIRYAWKIERVFDEWSYQKENSLQFGVLPYGTHRLQIKGQSAHGGWSPKELVLNIHVLKPFYLQIWFILSGVFALGLGLFFFYNRRTKLLKQRQRELEEEVKKATAQIIEDKQIIEKQAEGLRQLDKVKSRFFANISHELRTPLTLILGPLSYILDNSEAWEKEQVQQQLLVMQRNGKSLLQLIEEILDLSKLEANKLELIETATPVVQFFERIFWVFEPQFQSQGLDYELIFDLKEEDLHVLLDRKKLEKIINNYLSNAIKFTPRGNKLTVHIRETDHYLMMKVSDTGKGIHPDDLPHIFERFYQSKRAEQKLYGGTGIGLALVNEFAQLMGGRAYAKSTLGMGSQFYFDLPKKPIQTNNIIEQSKNEVFQDKTDTALIASIGTDFTILVVEDNEDMRNFVCKLLEPHYKKILKAQNGAEGLAQLEKHGTDIQLVISDVMMPEVDGLTMLREIKSSTTWQGIPVIMLTALAAERDKLAALTIGVDDYLAKPFSVPELLARVQNLLYNYHQRLAWKNSREYQEEEQADADDTARVQASIQEKEWIIAVEKLVVDSLGSNARSIEDIAAHFHLSVRQFRRKTKAITGLSPTRFIKEVQLQKARKELENGDTLSVKEVAFNNGFGQSSTFSKVFKNRFGKSPSEYFELTLSNEQ